MEKLPETMEVPSVAQSLDLPEHFPTISVSVMLGKRLKRAGAVIAVDPEAVNTVLLGQGIPKAELDNVELSFNHKFEASRMTHRGEAWIGAGSKTYNIAVYPSLRQVRQRDLVGLQKTLIHEARHVSDFIDRRFALQPGRAENYDKRRNLRKVLGLSMALSTALLAEPAIIEHASVPILLSSNNNAWEAALGITLPIDVVAAAYIVSKTVLYKTEDLEKRAFRAAKHACRSYPQAVSFPRVA